MTHTAPIPTERQIKLWFFRDLSDEQRLALFRLTMHEVPTDQLRTHAAQAAALEYSLRQQAQPTREEVQAAIRKGLTDNLENLDTGDAFDVDVLLRGCEHAMHSRGYQHPDAAAEILSGAAADAVMALYTSRISSALLPIDAPAREAGGGEPFCYTSKWSLGEIAAGSSGILVAPALKSEQYPVPLFLHSEHGSSTAVPDERLQAVERLLVGAMIASCDCDTKSPELHWHEPTCRYWKLGCALEHVQEMLEDAASSHAEPAAHSLQTLAPAPDAVKPGDET